MPELSQDTLIYGAGGLFALAALMLIVSLRYFRRSRRDVFWRRRREAGQRGWRLFVLAIVLFVVSGVTCASTLVIGVVREDNDPDDTPAATAWAAGDTPLALPTLPTDALEAVSAITPTLTHEMPPAPPADTLTPAELLPAPNATPTIQDVVLPTNTPQPPETVVVIITATPGNTPTQTPFPTYTPNGRTLDAQVTPGPDARLEITALDDEVSGTLLPVDPASSFPAGTERIYLFVSFENLTQGVLWRREMYRDDELIEGSSYLWGLTTDGRTSFFFGSDTGFPPGRYEVRLYLGDDPTPASRTIFTITPPDPE